MACPHVTGVAALLYSLGVTNTMDIRTVLRNTAARKDPPEKFGAGIIDAAAAVRSVARKNALTGDKQNTALIVVAGALGVLLLRGGGFGVLGSWLPEAIGLAMGLVLPDLITKEVGLTSYANLLAHSVLVPAIAVLLFNHVPLAARISSFAVAGVGITICLAHQTKTTLLPVLDPQKTQTWFVANVIFGILILAYYWANMNRWRGQTGINE